MNKKEKGAFALVAAFAMTSGGFAMGQSVNTVSSDQVIYACVTGVNGNITKVSNTPKTCPKGTTPISWNMVGPKGDQGVPGPVGPTGAQGIKGDSSSPMTYLTSPDGQKYPVFNTPFGVGVKIGSTFYQWVSGKPWIQPFGELWENNFFYTSEDCSGTSYIVAEKYLDGQALADYRTPEGPFVSPVTSGSISTTRFKSGLFLGDAGDKCQTLDSQRAWNALKVFADSAKAKVDQILATNPKSFFIFINVFENRIAGEVEYASKPKETFSITPNTDFGKIQNYEDYRLLYDGLKAVGKQNIKIYHTFQQSPSDLVDFNTWYQDVYSTNVSVQSLTNVPFLESYDADQWVVSVEQ